MVNPGDVPVVILCGGLGTRLREQTETLPKPMVEVGNAPILWHIMKIYGHYGFRRFILCLGYRGEVIKDFFRNFEYWQEDLHVDFANGRVHRPTTQLRREQWEVTCAETGLDTMTGGRIHRIRRYLTGDLFMVTYGDGLAGIDLAAELRFHVSHGRPGTLMAAVPTSRFGVLDLSGDGQVTRFREKPMLEEWVNGGFYVFDKRVLDYLTPECVLEEQPLARLAQDGGLMAYRHPGGFYCMDTYRDYVGLNRLWTSGEAGWKIWDD